MSANFAGFNTAARFKQAVESIAEGVVKRLFPQPRFAVVDSIDFPNRKVTVHYPEDAANTFTVPVATVMPVVNGATVRLAGPVGGRFVDEVLDGQIALQRMWVEDGSVTSPSVAFRSDNDMGFYKYGTSQLGVATGGTLKWMFGSSNNNCYQALDMQGNAINDAGKVTATGLQVNGVTTNQVIDSDSEALTIRRATAGTGVGSYIGFDDGNAGRMGYVGYPDTDDLWMTNQEASGSIYLTVLNNTSGRIWLRSDLQAYAETSDGTNMGIIGGAKRYVDNLTTNQFFTNAVNRPSGLALTVDCRRAGGIVLVVVAIDVFMLGVGWSQAIVSLEVNGVDQPDLLVFNEQLQDVSGEDTRVLLEKTWIIEPSADATLDLQAALSIGISGHDTDVRANSTHSTIKALVFD